MAITLRHARNSAHKNTDMQLPGLREPSEETQGFGCDEGHENRRRHRIKAPADEDSTHQTGFRSESPDHSKHVSKMKSGHRITIIPILFYYL